MEQFERIERKLIAHGAIIDYYHDIVKVPNGNVVTWDFIGHKGAAAVVPVTEEGKILMVRQYRNALDRETLEIPAGGLNLTRRIHQAGGGKRAGGGNRFFFRQSGAVDLHSHDGSILQ